MQLCGNGLAMIYVRPRGSFSANSCPIQDRHWQTLAAKFENAKLEIQFCLHGNGAFSCGMPIFIWVLINLMWLL